MPRKETCGGHEEHFLGMVDGCWLTVEGPVRQWTTKTGLKVLKIPRPRSRSPAGELYPRPFVPLPADSSADPTAHAAEVGQYFVRSKHWREVQSIKLPAVVACYGCGWIDEIKPSQTST